MQLRGRQLRRKQPRRRLEVPTEHLEMRRWFEGSSFDRSSFEEATSTEAASKEPAPKEAASNEAASKQAVSKEAISKQAASKEEASKEPASKEAASTAFLGRPGAGSLSAMKSVPGPGPLNLPFLLFQTCHCAKASLLVHFPRRAAAAVSSA